jgi:glycosyltransferase involved in cell wall biosynthesis
MELQKNELTIHSAKDRHLDQSIPSRVLFDVSDLSRWAGPAVGIIRVEAELARWAAQNIDNVVFVFFDPESGAYREINRKWISPLIERSVSVNPWILPNTRGRRHRSDRIPRSIRPAAMWIFQFRRSVLLLLERIRLEARNPTIKGMAERLQTPLITGRYRPYMFHADGTRRSVVSYRSFLGRKIEFTSKDTLICAGAPWEHSDVHSIKSHKERHGFRFVALCYDIIPLQFPHFYKEPDVVAFRDYYHTAFPLADVVVFTSHAIERDTLAYCDTHHLKINRTRVVPPGADAVVRKPSANLTLPSGIQRGRYALFVSTIEPRKGHQLIYSVWLRLLAEGIPQNNEFKLVFVGRPGWKVEGLIDRLKNDARLGNSLQLLTSADDDLLAALYEGAAFCIYPSVYEGYGLPIIEAFSRNKALLASTGGAIPEVVAGLSPCLDPHDEGLWHSMLMKWIVDPGARAPYEIDIRNRFKPTTWSSSAKGFFDAVR